MIPSDRVVAAPPPPGSVPGATVSTPGTLGTVSAPGTLGTVSAVVLVEGTSDRVALEVLARRRGRDLSAERVAVVAMHGITNLRTHLRRYGPTGPDLRIAGLCDAAEEGYVAAVLQDAGLGTVREAGFRVCRADLEDELITAVGVAGALDVIDAQGELRSLRRLQRQPAQRDRPTHDQVRRFLSGRSGNKERYARLFAEALDPDRTPAPLAGVLARV
ncbi:TOPRIM nucleotidyl transferase/hydrolase domain-containing protein [Nakamurella endophytica]|uniref:OLD protein-like TOPRIM domain-containing protein n=1 Tax=Nakamurella endophytica TaxID=1748367 RepID=A0A917WEZ7_9ACTN|nr:TOPRIM nucleotidyl transferase/hydrolase domain-containing protein [Nakamurella endophytica]GGL98644.1 hypothetical protein GCM10011594_18140 [Nakamurella endophytica]